MKEQHPNPPKFAERLLLWFLKEELAEEVLGDLDEKFHQTIKNRSKQRARSNYWLQVINYMRPFAFRFFKSKPSNKSFMFRHNFKVSYRQMLNNKVYTIINIGGLALGLVVAMLIGLWVYDEVTFNQSHDNYDNIVHVLRNDLISGKKSTNTSLTTGVGVLMAELFPDHLEEVFMVAWMEDNDVIIHGDKKLRELGLFMQENTPKVLGFDMTMGTLDGLKEIKSIMLSESFAERLFGDTNPMNKTVRFNGHTDLMVTGVYKDIPNNSKFVNANYVTRLELVVGSKGMNVWDNYNVNIYAQMNPNVDLNALEVQLTEATKPHLLKAGMEREISLIFHPMKDWHLRSEFQDHIQVTGRQMKFVWLYSIIGAFVLILACINFTNLSTARSEKRVKETGIRKTLGSIRKELVTQFYMESLLYSALAFLLSILLLAALLPWFNESAGKTIAAPWGMTNFWLFSVGFVLITTLLAGSYPAFYLSSFSPIKALKGRFSASKGASIPRRVLVVFQFTISIALIIGTITINNQIQVAKNRPIGYSPQGVISIERASPQFGRNNQLVRTELMKTGMAEAVGASNYPVINNRGWNNGFKWDGMPEGFDEAFNLNRVSQGYAKAIGMEFFLGRDFSAELTTDKNAVLINRSAMKAMQLENPVGTVLNYDNDSQNYTIIGVVEDMVKQSPFGRTDQSIMFLDDSWVNHMYIRLNPNLSASESIAGLQEAFEKVLPNDPFDFSFADEDYNRKFIAEERISKQTRFFSIIAILISCLGLFGLAAYVAEQRTKEIGIRKVLGASILSLWKLLSKEFTLLVFVASIISIPISYWVLDGWLSGYEIRTELSWWIFGLGAVGGLFITLVTVSFQALKAAMANPVKSLRTE